MRLKRVPTFARSALAMTAAVGAQALTIATCQAPTLPEGNPELVVVTGLVDGWTRVIDGGSFALLRSVGPELSLPGYSALSADSSLLLLSGATEARDTFLVVALDTKTLDMVWRLPVSALEGPSGVRVNLPTVLALSPDQTRLYVWPADSAGIPGIAAVNVVTRAITRFRELRVFATRIVVFRGHGALPEGTLAVTATRSPSAAAKPTGIFLLRQDLTVFDSIQVPTGGLGAYDAVLSPDEATLNVLAPPYLTALDLATRSVMATTQSLAASFLWPGVDGLIYEVDGGLLPDAPTSEFFIEHSTDLNTRRALSLLQAGAGASLPIARGVAVNRSGTTAYVLTGSLPIATAGQKAALVKYDLISGSRLRTLPLGQYGTAFRVFILPRP